MCFGLYLVNHYEHHACSVVCFKPRNVVLNKLGYTAVRSEDRNIAALLRFRMIFPASTTHGKTVEPHHVAQTMRPYGLTDQLGVLAKGKPLLGQCFT